MVRSVSSSGDALVGARRGGPRGPRRARCAV